MSVFDYQHCKKVMSKLVGMLQKSINLTPKETAFVAGDISAVVTGISH